MKRKNIGRIIGIVLFILAVVGSCTFYIYDKQKTKKAEAKAQQEEKIKQEEKETAKKKNWDNNVIKEADKDMQEKIAEFFTEKLYYYDNFDLSNAEEMKAKKAQLEADHKAGIIQDDCYKDMLTSKDWYAGHTCYSITSMNIEQINVDNKDDKKYYVWYNADFKTKNIETGEEGTDIANHFGNEKCALGVVDVKDDGSLSIYAFIASAK